MESETTSKTAVNVGAYFGNLSHVAFDSLMHHDIHSLSPFSDANPLMGLASHDGLYQLCAVAIVIGSVLWLTMQWFGRNAQVTDVGVAPEQLPAPKSPGFWSLWVWDLRSTWLWLVFLSIVPSLLLSSGLMPLLLLEFAVLLLAPATVMSKLFTKKSTPKDLRKLAIMVVVPMLSLIYILKSDDQITANATPIIGAIESFRIETGHYPDALEELTPKHLGKIPSLNYLLVQSQVTYRVTDGKPYLRISVAAGGFAHFEYDFASKSWNHYS